MLWHCRACSTAYSVGAPACPHCGSTDHQEEPVLTTATWVCEGCGTRYRLKLSRCPRCHGTKLEEDGAMPKITLHGGPSDGTPAEQPATTLATTPGPAPDTTETPIPETPPAEAEATPATPATPDVPDVPDVPEEPAQSARKADWVDYAVALGHDRETVEVLTKADLIDLVHTRASSADAGLAEGRGEAGPT